MELDADARRGGGRNVVWDGIRIELNRRFMNKSTGREKDETEEIGSQEMKWTSEGRVRSSDEVDGDGLSEANI